MRFKPAFLLWVIFHLSLCAVWAQTDAGATKPASQTVLDPSSMDASVDPCLDFYTYACGGWMKKNPIPPDQASWTSYSKLEDENLIELRQILENASAAAAGRDAVTQKIGDYYASCMDEKAIEAEGAKPLKPGLDEIEKLGSKAEIADVAGRMPDDGILFNFSSDQDFKDSSQEIAEADQGGLGLPDRDFYFKEDAKSAEIRKAYVAHVQKMLELAGEKPEAAASDAQTIMRIETELARGSMTRVERRDPAKLYHKVSSTELEQMSPSFRWGTYFTKVGLAALKSLNVVAPDFFKTMNAVLQKESLANWKAYLRWKLVHADAQYLSSPFVNENFNFYGKILQGKEQLRPRWKRCTDYVDSDLGEALGQAYVAKYFSPEAKAQA
ncbi:MAG TPA: M13 family metallopeptidase N-terminal domain-containing protein, partial [Terriglobales bacterium]|nr:M13 family metallopeptidase N-terminal domain-containing protein [Terriglobales bacterium]